MIEDNLLPHVPRDLVHAAYALAPGNEIASGKFTSPESSSALVANGFGWFLERKSLLPSLVDNLSDDWNVTRIELETEVRFPWTGGRHPWLDVVVEVPGHLIGVESKRYEPFRTKKKPKISDAYARDVWGSNMSRYGNVLRGIRDGGLSYETLDAAQLAMHAYGLRTEIHRRGGPSGNSLVRAHLVYLYSEPASWPDGRPVDATRIARHRAEVADFASRVRGDEVAFHSLTWAGLLDAWQHGPDALLSRHARHVRAAFGI